MTFILKSVVPWGRSFDEYVAMFNLSDDDLKRSIIGCGDGPAGFNARMHEHGHRVVSCDPLYMYSCDQIEQAILAARDEVMQQVRNNMHNFVWKTIRTPAELEQVRMSAMQEFCKDYKAGLFQGRYIPATLPALPFRNRHFDLCLCSHLLFLYSSLGLTFHLQSIQEMARVSEEVRIFPVVDTNGQRAEYFDELVDRVRASGLVVRIEPTRYDFLKNGHEMLRITHARQK
jgi:hypothetical protein